MDYRKGKKVSEETKPLQAGDEKTALGVTPNLAAALVYVIGCISGIIVFVVKKENRFVRFHAMQSIMLSVTIILINIIAGFIPFIGWIIVMAVPILGTVCWINAIGFPIFSFLTVSTESF